MAESKTALETLRSKVASVNGDWDVVLDALYGLYPGPIPPEACDYVAHHWPPGTCPVGPSGVICKLHLAPSPELVRLARAVCGAVVVASGRPALYFVRLGGLVQSTGRGFVPITPLLPEWVRWSLRADQVEALAKAGLPVIERERLNPRKGQRAFYIDGEWVARARS